MFIQVNATGADSARQLVAPVNVPSIANGSQVWLLDNRTNTNPIAKSSPVMTGSSGPIDCTRSTDRPGPAAWAVFLVRLSPPAGLVK